MNKPLFVHCHIFKNAGTSLIESFRHAFQENAIELEPADPDDYLSEDLIAEALQKNPELAFVSSHRVRLPLSPFINNRKIIPIIFFRDPIDRLGSVYRFEQKETRPTVYSALAKTTSMSVFFETILDVGFDIVISNVHAEFCSVGEKYTVNDAKQYLKNSALVGLVEDYHFSMALIENEVQKYYPEKTLLIFKENVTRNNNNISSGCLKTIDEIGVTLTEKLLTLNSLDYQLYGFVCNYLRDAWSNETNKFLYRSYIQKNGLEADNAANRINSAPSIQCLKKHIKKLQRSQASYNSAWIRLKRYKVDHRRPIIEAVKLEFGADCCCPSIASGQELCVDFKVRWPCALNHSALSVAIKNHRNTTVFNCKNISAYKCVSSVDEGAVNIYRFKFAVPEVRSGLYKIDVQAGLGLGDQFATLFVADAVIAFGIKSHISASFDIVAVKNLNFQVTDKKFISH